MTTIDVKVASALKKIYDEAKSGDLSGASLYNPFRWHFPDAAVYVSSDGKYALKIHYHEEVSGLKTGYNSQYGSYYGVDRIAFELFESADGSLTTTSVYGPGGYSSSSSDYGTRSFYSTLLTGWGNAYVYLSPSPKQLSDEVILATRSHVASTFNIDFVWYSEPTDSEAPLVYSLSPIDGAVAVSVSDSIKLTFSGDT
jgi:hypothetical protein